jgi:sterol 3beta-glucosyltransferase
VNVLQILIGDNSFNNHRKELAGLNEGRLPSSKKMSSRPGTTTDEPDDRVIRSHAIAEPVLATLLPTHGDSTGRSPGRSSFESRRSSVDVRGRSPAAPSEQRRGDRPGSVKSTIRTESVESHFSESFAETRDSSMAGVHSMDESNVSASQILNNSDVFRGPTSHDLARADSPIRRGRASQDTGTPSSRSKSPKGKSSIKQPDLAAATSPATQSSSTWSYPLSRATELAGSFRDHSKRVSTQLTSHSIGYLEKISGMWNAPTKHYGPVEGMPPDDDNPTGMNVNDLDNEYHSGRFREHFALPDSEILVSSYFAYFWRVLPLYGKIYISRNYFCFRSLLPGTRCKLVLPIRDIESATKQRGSYRQKYDGLIVTIRGHEEIFFDFSKKDARDDCTITLILTMDSLRSPEAGNPRQSEDNIAAIAEYHSLQEAREDGQQDHGLALPRSLDIKGIDAPAILFDDQKASILNFKPPKPLRVTCLTIGSRGDVQPYIALAKGLIADGHSVKIATHVEFEPWIRRHGIDFAPVSGDPGELMRICIQYGMFTVSFLKEAHGKVCCWLTPV